MSDKKKLESEMTILVSNIMDNYDKYPDEIKLEIDSLVLAMGSLNEKVNVYDKKPSKSFSLVELFHKAFGKKK